MIFLIFNFQYQYYALGIIFPNEIIFVVLMLNGNWFSRLKKIYAPISSNKIWKLIRNPI